MPYQTLADAVLIAHAGVVVFVVLGLPAIILGNRLKHAWANGPTWRVLHLAAISVVALQAWLGQYCPLTLLESFLRERAGQEGYAASFIGHWLHHLMYYEAPLWVFAVIYTLFAAGVAWAWKRYPPKFNSGGRKP